MWLPLRALLVGLVSASTLPIGAVVGIFFSPVREKVTACFMAFGAGAIVFAVATSLYGEALAALTEIDDGNCRQDDECMERMEAAFLAALLQIIAGVVGAGIYFMLNRWLQKMAGGNEQPQLQASMRSLPEARTWAGGDAPLTGGESEELQEASLRSVTSIGDSVGHLKHHRSRMGITVNTPPLKTHNSNGPKVALSMWLGIALDGIPESLMLGFMCNEGKLTWQLIAAILVANYPEAFSAASLLREYGISKGVIMLMWTSVFLGTGLLAMFGSLILPYVAEGNAREYATSTLEGLTGGAMFAMISTAMIPEAFHGAGEVSGGIFVLGFMCSCLLQAAGSRFGNPFRHGAEL